MRRVIPYLFLLIFVWLFFRTLPKYRTDPGPVITSGSLLIFYFTYLCISFAWPAKALGYFKSANGTQSHPFAAVRQNGSRSSATEASEASQLESIRQLLGPVPREFPGELKNYLRVRRPGWLALRFEDELWQTYRHQERIRREGKVIWGAVVQANVLLFRPGLIDCAAGIIWSEDRWFDAHPAELVIMGRLLFLLKGTTPRDRDMRVFADMLTNEIKRGMRLKVPEPFSRGREVFHSSLLFPRKHLPSGYLRERAFPIWLDPEGTGEVLLVPAAYWPEKLLMLSGFDPAAGVIEAGRV